LYYHLLNLPLVLVFWGEGGYTGTGMIFFFPLSILSFYLFLLLFGIRWVWGNNSSDELEFSVHTRSFRLVSHIEEMIKHISLIMKTLLSISVSSPSMVMAAPVAPYSGRAVAQRGKVRLGQPQKVTTFRTLVCNSRHLVGLGNGEEGDSSHVSEY